MLTNYLLIKLQLERGGGGVYSTNGLCHPRVAIFVKFYILIAAMLNLQMRPVMYILV